MEKTMDTEPGGENTQSVLTSMLTTFNNANEVQIRVHEHLHQVSRQRDWTIQRSRPELIGPFPLTVSQIKSPTKPTSKHRQRRLPKERRKQSI
jgi:hypothetical protein